MSRKKKPFAFFLWHRRLGLVALLLVFILSITGIMLNHTEALHLDERSISSDLILDWYGVNPTGTADNYSTENFWISQWGHQLFLNGKRIYTYHESLQGAVETPDMLAIALRHAVLLVDHDGEIIELIPFNAVAPIAKIGHAANRIALLDEDNIFYLSDRHISHFKQQAAQNAIWSAASTLDDKQLAQLKQAYRGQGLSLERVILDLHSGRLLHPDWGVYIMDLSAIIMMLLGISGVWVWWSRKLKMRRKKHYQKHH